MNKTCIRCNIEKTIDDFYSGHRRCKRCVIELNTERNKSMDKKVRRSHILYHRYRLRQEEFDAILKAQDFKCAVCREELLPENAAVDHDHSCCPAHGKGCGKCNRGILCQWCNRMLGQAKDNPETLRRGATYLESYGTESQ